MLLLLRIATLTVFVNSSLHCCAATVTEVQTSIEPSPSTAPEVINSAVSLPATTVQSIESTPSMLSSTPLPSPLLPSENLPLPSPVTVIVVRQTSTQPSLLPMSISPSTITVSLTPIPTSLMLITTSAPTSTVRSFTSQEPSTTSQEPSTTTTETSSSDINDSNDQSVPVAAIIGIVIGGFITVTALTLTVALLVCFCCCCFKSKKYEYTTGNDRRMTVQQWNITSAHFNINRVDSVSSFGSSRSRGSSLFGSFGFIRRYSNSADHISSTSVGNQSVPDLYSTPL